MRRFGTLPTRVKPEKLSVSESAPPSPKSTGECSEAAGSSSCHECPMMLKRINDLSVLLHNSEQENKEIYSQLNSEIQVQAELNQSLINTIENMKKNFEDRERIEKQMKESEEKIVELEKLPPQTAQQNSPPKNKLPRVAQLQPKKKS